MNFSPMNFRWITSGVPSLWSCSVFKANLYYSCPEEPPSTQGAGLAHQVLVVFRAWTQGADTRNYVHRKFDIG